MPIIGQVGRRSFKVRFLNVTIHVVLVLGAITMVYPLLLMLSGSVKGAVDSRNLTLFPEYLTSDDVLYKRWVEAKYNELAAEYSFCHRNRIFSFDAVTLPKNPVAQRSQDWTEFFDARRGMLNEFCFSIGNANAYGLKPELTRQFAEELKDEPKVQGDIARMNRTYGTNLGAWDEVMLPSFNLLRRGGAGNFNSFSRRAVDFALRQDRRYFIVYSLDAFFVERALKPKFGQDIRNLNAARGVNYRSWPDVTLTRTAPSDGLREDWLFFVRTLLNLQFIEVGDGARPDYQRFLRERYHEISLLNKRYETQYSAFEEVPLLHEVPRNGMPLADWDFFVTNVAKPEHLGIRSAEFMYRDFLQRKYGKIERLIESHQYGLKSLDELALPERLPAGNTAYEDDWIVFVAAHMDPAAVRPDVAASSVWRVFLTEPYREENQINLANLNSALGTRYETVDDIFVPTHAPANPAVAARWHLFIRDVCPRNLLWIDVKKLEPAWREFIRSRYATVHDLNLRYACIPASFDKIAMPLSDVEYFDFLKTRRHSICEFLIRNYATVLGSFLYSGRAILNTVIYCALSVAMALILNPLAAYALSRYKPPSQYKMLLFLMLTMAFPPIVLGIPNFLLLRQLGLLNTFAALVLPSAASGYSIFLLKGFFDSLPRELYESATLDGASEWTMFWHITMATSKPILAVVALGAFTAAYSNFMFAFITCQDPKMWTMMVSIYQLEQRSSMSVSFAALVIAAIPTLLVFVFCQNIIMRGIVVPTEK